MYYVVSTTSTNLRDGSHHRQDGLASVGTDEHRLRPVWQWDWENNTNSEWVILVCTIVVLCIQTSTHGSYGMSFKRTQLCKCLIENNSDYTCVLRTERSFCEVNKDPSDELILQGIDSDAVVEHRSDAVLLLYWYSLVVVDWSRYSGSSWKPHMWASTS